MRRAGARQCETGGRVRGRSCVEETKRRRRFLKPSTGHVRIILADFSWAGVREPVLVPLEFGVLLLDEDVELRHRERVALFETTARKFRLEATCYQGVVAVGEGPSDEGEPCG